MKKLAAAGYLTLFRDFKLARMIKTYRSASCHQVLKIRECYIMRPIRTKTHYLRFVNI